MIDIALFASIARSHDLAMQMFMRPTFKTHVFVTGWTDNMIASRILQNVTPTMRTGFRPLLQQSFVMCQCQGLLRLSIFHTRDMRRMHVPVVGTKDMMAGMAYDTVGGSAVARYKFVASSTSQECAIVEESLRATELLVELRIFCSSIAFGCAVFIIVVIVL
jgi:hypothetical protein